MSKVQFVTGRRIFGDIILTIAIRRSPSPLATFLVAKDGWSSSMAQPVFLS